MFVAAHVYIEYVMNYISNPVAACKSVCVSYSTKIWWGKTLVNQMFYNS